MGGSFFSSCAPLIRTGRLELSPIELIQESKWNQTTKNTKSSKIKSDCLTLRFLRELGALRVDPRIS
jgi:hypothetical protein